MKLIGKPSWVVTSCLSIIMLMLHACNRDSQTVHIRKLFENRGIKVLSSADRVEVFRIDLNRDDPRLPSQAPPPTFIIGGFGVISTEPGQAKDFAQALAKVLLDDQSYAWDTYNQCLFQPGVAFRIWSGAQSVLVLICFHCNQLGVIADGDPSGNIVIRESDPARPALIRLAKQAFPNDKEIEGLTP